GTLLQVCTAMGRFDEAVTYLRMPVPEALLQTPIGAHYLQARRRYFHATGRHPAALADFQACGRLMSRLRLEFAAFVPWWADAARTCVALGRQQQARELVQDQLNRLAPTHLRVRGMTLRVLADTSEIKKRPAILREAVEVLQACGDRL